MSSANDKTNVMRLLENAKIPFERRSFDPEAPNGQEIARILGEDPSRVFKTLVTVGKSNAHYVFMVPVCMELDLKKAAAAAGEKSIEMVKSRELLGLTGYVHGGCSPIGMKKPFRTTVDEAVSLFDSILFSGGRRGEMVEVAVEGLRRLVPFGIADVTKP